MTPSAQPSRQAAARSPSKHLVTVHVQDRSSVLLRVMNLFRRRGVTVDSLTVVGTERVGIRRLTWIVDTSGAGDLTPVLAQLEKFIDVIDVSAVAVPPPAHGDPDSGTDVGPDGSSADAGPVPPPPLTH